jgi:hypothetical protein
MSNSRWRRVRPGFHVRDGYTVTRIENGRWYRLDLDGSVFTLLVPSRFRSIAAAQNAADIDERRRTS